MRTDSDFLSGLLGKQVRIVAVDERNLPPMPSLVLREISSLGVVAADDHTAHFFPWNEIVEITPVPGATSPEPADGDADREEVLACLGIDSEP